MFQLKNGNSVDNTFIQRAYAMHLNIILSSSSMQAGLLFMQYAKIIHG
jgi:hypothetical protein